jgi:hypothetical protein
MRVIKEIDVERRRRDISLRGPVSKPAESVFNGRTGRHQKQIHRRFLRTTAGNILCPHNCANAPAAAERGKQRGRGKVWILPLF